MKVIINPGNVADRGDVGITSNELGTCNSFDINAANKNNTHLPTEGQPNGGEELIGRRVEVRAATVEDGSFTLQGSTSYYVKTVNE